MNSSWASLIVSFLVAMGMWSGEKPKLESSTVYLGSVEAPAQVAAGDPVDVAISGDLPNPAYELLEPAVERQGHRVVIRLASRQKKGGMTIQVLAPFKRTVTLTDLEPGAWTIAVEASGGQHQDVAVQVTGAGP